MTRRSTMLVFAPLLVAALACASGPVEHGHDHGPGEAAHPHGEEEGESVAVTRWTETHELFVELDAPVAGQPFAYHAHVTRLADNHAASSGVLTIRFEADGFAVEAHQDPQVARAGIFAAEARAPQQAGAYRLVFAYADGEERAEWDAGTVRVGATAPEAHEAEAAGEIGFLKESQWQVPFAVQPASLRAIAPALTASGVAQAGPGGVAVVAAPVEGLIAWADALPVVGRRVRRGEPLATLIPSGSAVHWATLQADLTTARIDRELAAADLRRLEGLAPEALVSARRVEEAVAALARAEAQVVGAERRVTALQSGGAGAVSIRAPADGVIVAVGASHGAAVTAGAPLVSVSAGGEVLVQARVHTRHAGGLAPVQSLSVMRGDWPAPRDLLALGGRLLTDELVYDARALSAPLSVSVPSDVGLVPGDLVEISVGIGEPVPRLAVPRAAVVEVNGQDVVFVQRSGESFTRRRVALGERDATHVEVRSGLAEGEWVVVQGGFDVHVAALSGALDSHRH